MKYECEVRGVYCKNVANTFRKHRRLYLGARRVGGSSGSDIYAMVAKAQQLKRVAKETATQ